MLSIGSAASFASFASVGSFASAGSILSSMSAASVLSYQSSGSALSHQSNGSVLSSQADHALRGHGSTGASRPVRSRAASWRSWRPSPCTGPQADRALVGTLSMLTGHL